MNSLVKQPGIKNELKVYMYERRAIYYERLPSEMKNKYAYIFNVQYNLLKKVLNHKVLRKYLLVVLFNLRNHLPEIPERLRGEIKEITFDEYYDKGYDNRRKLPKAERKTYEDNAVVKVITFRPALLAFLKQKRFTSPRKEILRIQIVWFLELLNEHTDGKDFDEYIGDWAKKLTKEFTNGGQENE